ncbi:cytochrome P450 [Citrobacter amalonaticus]|uniref:cytochrome P450 n=1 Tax=Citrobacter amalonaticus TaxID=35703 RepID=UPI001159305F|nr:cytochrome P450 [Citrobacter amalonaticus]
MLTPYCSLKDKNSALNLAFSRGPRICGGKGFALIEMASLVYIFLKYACFSLTSDSPCFSLAFIIALQGWTTSKSNTSFWY